MTREAIHPGEFLADELEEIGMTRTELARQIDVPPNRISQLIHGKRDLTADTALRLGRFFGTGPELWLNLQKTYELDKAKIELGKKSRKSIRGNPTKKYIFDAQCLFLTGNRSLFAILLFLRGAAAVENAYVADGILVKPLMVTAPDNTKRYS